MVKSNSKKPQISRQKVDYSDDDENFYATKKEKENAERLMISNKSKLIKKKKQRITKFKSIKENDDQGPIVKNFCVSLNLLEDELVKNALQGKLDWKEVFEEDDYLTKRYRKQMSNHAKYQQCYLFENEQKEPMTNQIEMNKKYDENNNQINRHQSKSKIETSNLFCKQMPTAFNKQTNSSESPAFNSKLAIKSNEFKSTGNLKKDVNLDNLNTILIIIKNLESNRSNELVNKIPIKCLNCSYITTSIKNIFLHSTLNHKNFCELCSTQFKSVYSYFRHFSFHIKSAEFTCLSSLEFKCTNCSATFNEESKLLDHFNACYTIFDAQCYGQTFRFKCRICNFTDTSFKSYRDHYFNSHLQVKCSFCDQWFKNLDQIEQHAFYAHKPFIHNYECEFCFKKFTFKSSYDEHLKFKHCIQIQGIQKSCFLCAHSFATRDQNVVLEHLASHCNIFLYNCDLCEEFRFVL